MTLYIILCFVALCAGMALSVYAFGTGGKRKRIFQDIYFSAEETDGVGVLYTKTGEYSAVLKIENPVQKYSADIDSYYDFTHLFTALAQTLGEGYAIHKQDIFVRKQFASEPTDGQEFLSSSYFRYFKGRPYTDSLCYLTITQEAKKSRRLFSFDSKKKVARLPCENPYSTRPVTSRRRTGQIPEQSRSERVRRSLLRHELQRPHRVDDQLQGGR